MQEWSTEQKLINSLFIILNTDIGQFQTIPKVWVPNNSLPSLAPSNMYKWSGEQKDWSILFSQPFNHPQFKTIPQIWLPNKWFTHWTQPRLDILEQCLLWCADDKVRVIHQFVCFVSWLHSHILWRGWRKLWKWMLGQIVHRLPAIEKNRWRAPREIYLLHAVGWHLVKFSLWPPRCPQWC